MTLTPMQSLFLSVIFVIAAALILPGCEHGSAPLWESLNRQAH